MRVVIDTNVLLVSIPKKSKYRLIFDCLISKKFTLIISNNILTEYEEIISQKTNSIVSKNIVELLLSLKNVEKKNVHFKWEMIDADKDDNKFTDCAISGNADYLVTNDKHFDIVKNIDFPSIAIININEFLEILKNLKWFPNL